jgi:hypothetical protein
MRVSGWGCVLRVVSLVGLVATAAATAVAEGSPAAAQADGTTTLHPVPIEMTTSSP